MAKFSASDAAFSGFRLVRENPRTILVWGLLMTVLATLYTAVSIHFFGPQMEAFSTYMATADGEPEPQAMAKAAEGLWPAMLWGVPYNLVLSGVVLSAVNRLVLRRSDHGFFHLGLGMVELRQIAVGVLIYATLMGVLLVGALLSGFLGAMGGLAGAFLGLLSFVGAISAMIFLAIRLSFASAATFDSGTITFFRTMALTKGCFWPLFGAYVLAMVMCVIVVLLLMTIVSAVAAIASGDFSVAGRLMQADTSSLKAYFTPIGIVQSLFSGVLSVLTNLIIFAPAPTIYKELRERETAAEGAAGW